jgi:AraC-like DNA-binding protein
MCARSDSAAHRDLWSAEPANTTVAAIAHRWGFTHLDRFAAANKMMFDNTPLQALHAAR